MKKKPAFPNDTFQSQNDYFDFAITHNVFGTDAYKLKKLNENSFKENYDFGISKVTKREEANKPSIINSHKGTVYETKDK